MLLVGLVVQFGKLIVSLGDMGAYGVVYVWLVQGDNIYIYSISIDCIY